MRDNSLCSYNCVVVCVSNCLSCIEHLIQTSGFFPQLQSQSESPTSIQPEMGAATQAHTERNTCCLFF